MDTELSQNLKHLKSALHVANQNLSAILKATPDQLLDLFQDEQDPSEGRDRFVYISNSILSIATNLSEARLVLVNLGTYSTIENFNAAKKIPKKGYLPPETGEDEEGEEGV